MHSFEMSLFKRHATDFIPSSTAFHSHVASPPFYWWKLFTSEMKSHKREVRESFKIEEQLHQHFKFNCRNNFLCPSFWGCPSFGPWEVWQSARDSEKGTEFSEFKMVPFPLKWCYPYKVSILCLHHCKGWRRFSQTAPQTWTCNPGLW